MADVRIDTNEIEVVSAKDNNQKMQDIAEVVDSSNPFVANGQSKVLKHNNQYYLTTNPNYNWYKEVAQGCFAYKDGSNEITEKISAKGYRPRLNSNDVKYNFDFTTRGAYKIVIGKNENGLYATHISGTGDNYKEKTSQIVNSSGVNSFYLLVHSQGGSGGNSSDVNGDCGRGGGSGCCSIISITLMDTEYDGVLFTVEQTSDGVIMVYAGGNDGAIIHILCPGMQGKSAKTQWWQWLLAGLFTHQVLIPGLIYSAIDESSITDSRGSVSTMDLDAEIRSAVTSLNNRVSELGEGAGGVMLSCDILTRNFIRYDNVPIRFKQIKNIEGVSGQSKSPAYSICDNPESVSELKFTTHSAGSNGGRWGAYQGGRGGGASLFANGGAGGDGTAWTGGRGGSGSKGSGGGGAAGGMNGNSGGTGGNALIQLYW